MRVNVSVFVLYMCTCTFQCVCVYIYCNLCKYVCAMRACFMYVYVLNYLYV